MTGQQSGFVRVDGDDLILAVRLTPRSSTEGTGGVWKDGTDKEWLQVSVRAVPERGRANTALIGFIAERLRLPARDVILESGGTNRLKRLRLCHRSGERDRILGELGEL